MLPSKKSMKTSSHIDHLKLQKDKRLLDRQHLMRLKLMSERYPYHKLGQTIFQRKIFIILEDFK